ncbi:MAG: ytfP [Verrucomicrobia bacterium]|nr:ytfP [Verrucomicrobiota bacterium]
MHLVFVYGTLKRGGSNHAFLAGQEFIADARTPPGFTLYVLDEYPGMVAEPSDSDGVTGEIWFVDGECLRQLDLLEGIAEGLYERVSVPLVSPPAEGAVESYLYAQSVAGRRRLGSTWPV